MKRLERHYQQVHPDLLPVEHSNIRVFFEADFQAFSEGSAKWQQNFSETVRIKCFVLASTLFNIFIYYRSPRKVTNVKSAYYAVHLPRDLEQRNKVRPRLSQRVFSRHANELEAGLPDDPIRDPKHTRKPWLVPSQLHP